MYKQLGDIMGMYTANNQSALDMYHLSIKKDPNNYKAAYKLVTKFMEMYNYDSYNIKHLDIYKAREYAVEQINRLENKKETEPLNIEQIRYILFIMKYKLSIESITSKGHVSHEIIEREDWVCNFIKEYIEDNKFYDTFFGKDAQFYRQKTMNYISLAYLYGQLAIGYREIMQNMAKSEYYWELYDEDSNRIDNIMKKNEKADWMRQLVNEESKIINNINEKDTER